MIANDQELQVTLERIAQFQAQLARLRKTESSPANYQPPQHRRVLLQAEVVDAVCVLAGGAVHRPGVHHATNQCPPLTRGDYRGVLFFDLPLTPSLLTPSLARRGRLPIPHEPAYHLQDPIQVPGYLFVGKSQELHSEGLDKSLSAPTLLLLARLEMAVAVDLQCQF